MTHSKNLKNKQWQLKALAEALGDLVLDVEDTLSIGRGKDNDVVLGSKQVSRQHAELNVLNGELFIKDLGSANGTFVNDNKIEPNKSKHLKLNDRVSFATFSFAVMQPQLTEQTSEAEEVMEDATTQPVTSATLNEPETKHSDSENIPIHSDIQVASPEPEQAYPVETDEVGTITDAKLEVELEQPIPIGDPNQQRSTTQDAPVNNPESVVHTRHDDETSAEHFQELAQEADPEVLRAKQAATAKFSGTVDLNHDEPQSTLNNETINPQATFSENADSDIMDSRNKVATVGEPEVSTKNPSVSPKANRNKGKGSLFVWALVIGVIIAIAIWLFNSGTLS